MINCDIQNRPGDCIDHTFHPGSRADVLVVIGHGVTGNKDRPQLVALAEGLSKLGWPCLRFSFSGNGDSGGRFEDSCITKEVSDLQSVLDLVPADVRVAYAGHSMGAAVGVLTAARDLRIRALILLAGMTHTAAFLAREFSDVVPGVGFMWDDENCPLSQNFADDLNAIQNTLAAAESLTQPCLFIHGSADDVVPIQDSRDAFEAVTSEKEWVEFPDAGHSFGEADYPRLVEVADRWLAKHFGQL
jgi:uncharacterized protein